MSVVTIRCGAADRCEDEYGDLRSKPDEAEQNDRTGHSIDQPALGNALHPCAGKRYELACEEKPEISMPECPKRVRKFRRADGPVIGLCDLSVTHAANSNYLTRLDE